MDRVEEESATLIAQLERTMKPNRFFIYRVFEEAKKIVEDGDVSLESQYQAALDFYNSSLTHPTAVTDDNEEVIAPVGMGHNWLSSRVAWSYTGQMDATNVIGDHEESCLTYKYIPICLVYSTYTHISKPDEKTRCTESA